MPMYLPTLFVRSSIIIAVVLLLKLLLRQPETRTSHDLSIQRRAAEAMNSGV
jgi:hypothetical protein